MHKGNMDNFTGRSHTKRRKTNRTRTEWLVRQRSLEQWHMCAVTFFNGLCVITNFFNGIHVKAPNKNAGPLAEALLANVF